MYNSIKIFHRPELSPPIEDNINYSNSPYKPQLFIRYLNKKGQLYKYHPPISDFRPFENYHFKLAHTSEYVNGFFSDDKKYSETNGLKWSYFFANSIRYTNSSLYHAIRHSIFHTKDICLSPTSGFHHASPKSGAGYCTFSGQVIASLLLYEELGLSGAYIDLDEHFGNSIEDSRTFVPELKKAIPRGCNINPVGSYQMYIDDYIKKLNLLEKKILNKEIHYVVYCHGADSWEYDDMKGSLDLDRWFQCTKIFCTWIRKINNKLGYNFPVSMALFGGYNKRNYNKVLELHTKDLDIIYKKLVVNENTLKVN